MKRVYLFLILMYMSRAAARIREYYVAAVDQDWNYAPYGGNMVSNDTTLSDIFLKSGKDRIGRMYTKVIYREFTDINFTMPINRPHWMGILGPLLRAEVGDEMHVYFKNLAYTSGRPFSIHPHGVLYTKANEGALYLDTTNGINKIDDGVLPGETYRYIWKVTPEFGPSRGDPPCIPWGYHSHVHADKDIDTGLVGLLLTCKRGALYADGTKRDPTKEYVIYMDKTDENNSWMLKTNVMRCGDPSACQNNTDPEFLRSNMMWHINGYVFGNMPDLELTVGERVIWHIISLNSGIQSISFSGNTVTHRNHRLDTIPFLPSTFLSAEMIPAYVGNFLVYSRISENFASGMQAYYTVNPPVHRERRQASPTPPKTAAFHNNQQSRSTTNLHHQQHPGSVPRMWNFPSVWNPRFWGNQNGISQRRSQNQDAGISPGTYSIFVEFLKEFYPNLYRRMYSTSQRPSRGTPTGRNGQRQGSATRRNRLNNSRRSNAGSQSQSNIPQPNGNPSLPIPAPPPPATGSRLPAHPRGSNVPRQQPRIPHRRRRPSYIHTIDHQSNNKPSHTAPVNNNPPRYPSTTRRTTRTKTTRSTTTITTTSTTTVPPIINNRPTRPPRFRNAWKRPGRPIKNYHAGFNRPESLRNFPVEKENRQYDRVSDFRRVKIDDLETTPTSSPPTSSDGNSSNKNASGNMDGNRNVWKFDWTDTTRSHRVAREAPRYRGGFFNARARVYYLSIEKIMWDYGPSGLDMFNGGSLLNNSQSRLFFEQGPTRIGGKYIKAQFIQYTDQNFNKRVPRSRHNFHLGLLGPPILVETGDNLIIVLKNNADKPYSFLPYGVNFAKSQEGFYYKDKATGQMTGKIARPNETVTYYFSVPDVYAGPTADDAPCVTHTYQSAVNPVKDMNSGLLGPMVICQRGQLQHHIFSPVHRRTWFSSTRHVYLALLTVDENESWYLHENIRRFTTPSNQIINLEDTDFKESNAIHSINGMVFGNLDGINFCLYDNVVWHVMNFGGITDMHGLYIHGQTWDEFGNNVDSKGLLPGFTSTMTSRPDTVGTWSIVCRTNSHFEGGMVALYKVNQCGKQERLFRKRNSRKYYIGALEVEWDYAPIKRSLADGEELTTVDQAGGVFVLKTDVFIGSKYKKAIYRQFTDETFKTEVPRTSQEQHLGLMGPYIKAEVGETLEVVFKNMASRPYSIHPQGLKYNKANEGASYADGSATPMDGTSVAPGETFQYQWEVPVRAGPGRNDPNCIGRMYYSSTDSVKDIYSGLFGPLVVCREGILNSAGIRKDVDREFAIMFMVLDENRSHYLKENILLYAPQFAKLDVNLKNMPMDHNHMHSNPFPTSEELTSLQNASTPVRPPVPLSGGIHNEPEHFDTPLDHVVSSPTDNSMASGTGNAVVDRGEPMNTGVHQVNDIWDHSRTTTSPVASSPLFTDYGGSLSNTISNDYTQWSGNSYQHMMKKRSTGNNFKQVISSKRQNTRGVSKVRAKKTKSRRKRDLMNTDIMIPPGNIVRIETQDPLMQESSLFQHSNHMNSINGRLMGNLNGIEMSQGDKVAWYVLALGSAEDYHPVHIHGQVFTSRSDRGHGSDVVEVFPSTSDTVEMLAVNAGNWILHCHFSKHALNGMQLIYTVNPKK